MSFKENIRYEALDKIEPTDTGSINIFVNDFNNKRDIIVSLYWYSEDREFEYICCGKDTLCRWLKGRGYSFYIKTPKIVKELYTKVRNERLEE